MLEESIPAAWASLNSWFTPALLFVVLNVVIGTIAIASGLGTQKHPQQQQQQQHPQLVRSPSVLQRIKSINLYGYRSEDLTPFSSITTTTTTAPPPDEQENTQQVLDSFHEQEQQPQLDDNPHHLETEESDTQETETETPYFHVEEHHMTRTTSDSKPASGEMPVKLPKKMKKSASVKSAFLHFEEKGEEVLKVRPATVREGKKAVHSFGDDEEVDAKADDFINKFKQQLKLQRLDSILRYKEMLGRGTTEK